MHKMLEINSAIGYKSVNHLPMPNSIQCITRGLSWDPGHEDFLTLR